MPEYTNKFLVNTNLEFNHRSVINSLNNITKQISLSGLKENTLHLEVLFDKQISESDLKINKNNYDYLSNKINQSKKERFEIYFTMFIVLILSAIVITSARMMHNSYKFR